MVIHLILKTTPLYGHYPHIRSEELRQEENHLPTVTQPASGRPPISTQAT